MAKQDIPEEIKNSIIEMFLTEGMSFKDIGAATNVPPTKVSAIIKEAGVKDPRKTICEKFETLDSPKDKQMLAAQIYKKFPEYDFWEKMRLPFKLNSLKWFLSGDGEDYLNLYIREFHTPVPERKMVEITAEKIGEDYQIKKKLTRKDFIQ